MIVNRLAWIGLISVIFLVLAGATVRVTGSGLGCPDWPFCWGCWVPPTDAKQIDIASLDLEKFKKHATRKGIDPETITRETILESFNPVQTWIEYGNRLASLPLGLATLLLAFSSLLAKNPRGTPQTPMVDYRTFVVLPVGCCRQCHHGCHGRSKRVTTRNYYAPHGVSISADCGADNCDLVDTPQPCRNDKLASFQEKASLDFVAVLRMPLLRRPSRQPTSRTHR